MEKFKRPRICIISGMHGNEPAGCITLKHLMVKGYFQDWPHTIIIPCANSYGLHRGVRYMRGYRDMNRDFTEAPRNGETRRILGLRGTELTIDLHEGWGFYSQHRGSLGNSFTVCGPHAEQIALMAAAKINMGLSADHKYVVRHEACDIPGTLSCYIKRHGGNFILMETAGQNNAQPLWRRAEQIKTLLDTVREYFSNNI